MSQDRYHTLIDELCAIERLPHPARLYQRAALKVNGVSFSLRPGGPGNEDCCLYAVDYGEPPPQRRHLVLQRLLEANTLMADPFLPKFGIEHLSGKVVLTGYIRLDKASGDSLIRVLRHHALQAREWRRTHFLLEQERIGAAGRPRGSIRPTGHALSKAFTN